MKETASATSWLRSLAPFVVMCVGMFIALLDIQIVAFVAARHRRRTIRGPGSDQLGADGLSDRRNRRDPAVGLADARPVHAMRFSPHRPPVSR